MYKSFEEAEQAYYGFWYGEKADHKKAIEIAEHCLDTYKDHKNQIIMDLLLFYGETKDTVKCKEMFNLGFENQVWYPKEFFNTFWNDDIYKEEVKRWHELREISQKNAKLLYEVELPTNYDKNNTYPLFISLHGWGEDLNLFKMFWKSNRLRDDFIHVFIQSSQMVGAYHYTWNDREKSLLDIKSVITDMKENYNTSDLLIFGGFSEGATRAMDFAFNLDDLERTAFISLNPNRADKLSSEDIKSYQGSVKGAIITGDLDDSFDEQKAMIADFEKNDIKCKLHVTKNFGHWFPDDLPKLIDEAIDFAIK